MSLKISEKLSTSYPPSFTSYSKYFYTQLCMKQKGNENTFMKFNKYICMIKTLFLLSTVYCEIKKKINNEL